MQFNDVVNLIGNVGFPIAVTLYVLVRLEGKMEKLNDSINHLSSAIEKREA